MADNGESGPFSERGFGSSTLTFEEGPASRMSALRREVAGSELREPETAFRSAPRGTLLLTGGSRTARPGRGLPF